MTGDRGPHRLILFDIDATLIYTGGAGRRAMTRAFVETFGVENAFDGVPLPGRTDPEILGDAMARCSLNGRADLVAAFRAAYFRCLGDELGRLPPSARVLPGVDVLLRRLAARAFLTTGLLTGNYSDTAELKLSRFGLWRWFRCGAYGEDAVDRPGLVPVARRRADQIGRPVVAPADVIIVGDTPLDIECGKANGARTVAVATGGTPVAALAEAGADLAMDDLSDWGRFVEFVEG